MNSDTLEAIVRSANIPSMPSVATRCYELSQDPMCSYDKLVALLSTDPGIAAAILRLSNSAMFGVVRQVDSLKQAITLLGLSRTRDLVLVRCMVQALRQARSELIEFEYYWRRSLTTAVIASRLAAARRPRGKDEAFIAGLLADVGVVILAQALPSKYVEIAEQYRNLSGAELQARESAAINATHADVSAMVLQLWMLPEAIVEAVRHHHAAADSIPLNAPGRDTASFLGAGDAISQCLCVAKDADQAAVTCIRAVEPLGMDAGGLCELLNDVQVDVE
ncbi:MAG: HDOD domain-containing protein, partial [Phycisphaerae bacterium]